jgi:paraquat-inducible protein A
MNTDHKSLIACRECDLVLREIDLKPGGSACCACCGSTLYRNTPDSLERTLALILAAAILFIIANIYPILGIEIKGTRNATNLFGAVQSLWDQGVHTVACLVFATTILLPTIELALMIYLLLPLKLKLELPGTTLILRYLQGIKPWGMVEVFMLGILVSLVKLSDQSNLIPGVALWSFLGLTLLLAAAAATFNPREIWNRLDWNSCVKELQ